MCRALKQGDVRRGDRVRLQMKFGSAVEGIVTETVSDGGVVGIKVEGLPYSAGLPFVTLLERGTVAEDALEKIRVAYLVALEDDDDSWGDRLLAELRSALYPKGGDA